MHGLRIVGRKMSRSMGSIGGLEREREGSGMVEERERGPSENEGKALGFDSFT